MLPGTGNHVLNSANGSLKDFIAWEKNSHPLNSYCLTHTKSLQIVIDILRGNAFLCIRIAPPDTIG